MGPSSAGKLGEPMGGGGGTTETRQSPSNCHTVTASASSLAARGWSLFPSNAKVSTVTSLILVVAAVTVTAPSADANSKLLTPSYKCV